MDAKVRTPKSLTALVREEQLKHACAAGRRAVAARDRLIAAGIWCAISLIMPANWKWVAWFIAFVGLFLAAWNWELMLIESRLSAIGPSSDDFA